MDQGGRNLRGRSWIDHHGISPEVISMSVTIAGTDFERVRYDADADVLYLHHGAPETAVEFNESPEGHHLRYGPDGRLIGITIVRPAWLLEHKGSVTITLPEEISIDRDDLGAALAAA
jgi:uncharacterized protein YuzE